MQQNPPLRLSKSKLPRANRSDVEIKRYVEAFKNSDLSMTNFCRKNQLAISTFSKWFNNSLGSVKTFKPLVVAPVPKPTPERLQQERVTLEFQGITLTFSNIKTPTLIINIVKGLTK